MAKILIVEDDIYLATTIQYSLKYQHLTADLTPSLKGAYQKIAQKRYDLIVLDRKLGEEDGLELIEYLSASSYTTRILMLTQYQDVSHRLEALRIGADDYLSKPFCMDELVLRVKRLLSMEKTQSDLPIVCHQYKFYPHTGTLSGESKRIVLRRRESEILSCLLRYKNRVVTREMLVQHVWGSGTHPTTTTVDVYMRRLRLVLRDRQLIKTVRGFGYMIKDQISPAK